MPPRHLPSRDALIAVAGGVGNIALAAEDNWRRAREPTEISPGIRWRVIEHGSLSSASAEARVI
jgi:hypothetical protein